MTQGEGDTERDRDIATETNRGRRSAETDRDGSSGGRRKAWRDGRTVGRTDGQADRRTGRQRKTERASGTESQTAKDRKRESQRKRAIPGPHGPVAERKQERQHKKRTDEGRKRKDEESRYQFSGLSGFRALPLQVPESACECRQLKVATRVPFREKGRGSGRRRALR